MDGDLKRKLMGSILLPTKGRRLEIKRSRLLRRRLVFRVMMVLVAILLFIWGIMYAVS
jgi:hypothetical protein